MPLGHKLALAFITLVVATVGLLDHLGGVPLDDGDVTPREFVVPAGATLKTAGAKLRREGIARGEWVFRVHLVLHAPPLPKAGRHLVHPGMNLPALLAALADKPLSEDAPLTLVEGWRARDADAWLTQAQLIDEGAYLAAIRAPSRFELPAGVQPTTLEGYLLPDTYRVTVGRLDVDKLIARQLGAFRDRFLIAFAPEIAHSGRTVHELVTVASMLEREEPNPDQRAAVAGVIYKRLDGKTPLGIDATSRYALTDWNDRSGFLSALRDVGDAYNTRLKPGLPPGPIGAPSLSSLIAALRPQSSPYWYYLHDAEKHIHFARNAQEHEANRKRFNVY